jgi:hypothetical protein
VRPSKIKPVTAVVEVSFATTGLKDLGSEIVDRTIVPPHDGAAATSVRDARADGVSEAPSGSFGLAQPEAPVRASTHPTDTRSATRRLKEAAVNG